jgi:hypothetical protein
LTSPLDPQPRAAFRDIDDGESAAAFVKRAIATIADEEAVKRDAGKARSEG